jgi:hypothetical protein
MSHEHSSRFGLRTACLVGLVVAAAALAACGDAPKPAAAPGSPEHPLVGRPTEKSSSGRLNEAGARATDKPGYEKLVERQTSRPRSRFTPCNLVTAAQAHAIFGAPVQSPLEAPQGPTCIYRTKSGKGFVTLAVQSADLARLKRQARRPQRVDVGSRAAFCGTLGQPTLYVSLSRGRVLSIAAPCETAKQFALKALPRLD